MRPTYVVDFQLAHIKHMNHGPAFQALWARLKNEVRTLQSRGYFGDGFWSSGTRLTAAGLASGHRVDPGELPEYMVRIRVIRYDAASR
jgi:DNA-dependent metalloprotease WSS1